MAPRGRDWVKTLERFREKRTGNTAAPGTFMFGSLVELCPAAGVALLLLNNTGFFFFNRSMLEDSAVFLNIFLFLKS